MSLARILKPFPVIGFVHGRQFHRRLPVLSGLPQFNRLNKEDSETIAQTLRPLIGEKNISMAEVVRAQHGLHILIRHYDNR